MKLYSIISFRPMVSKIIDDLEITHEEKKNLKVAFFDFFKVHKVLDMNIFKNVYMSYQSEFYISESDACLLTNFISINFGITIENIPDSESIEPIHFTDFDGFKGLIEKARSFMSNPEAKNKKNLVKEQVKEITAKENKIRHNLIQSIRKPIPQSIENRNVLSIDFEYDQNNDCRISECGLSAYFNGEYTHEHYIIEGNYEHKRNYSLQFKFKFGESKIITVDQLMRILLEKLKMTDYVVGHALLSEHIVMSYHGLNMLAFKKTKAIDIQYIFKSRFDYDLEHKLVSLGTLLDQLSIPNEDLHNAGNDAAYTLKAFLKMFDFFSIYKSKKKIHVSSINT